MRAATKDVFFSDAARGFSYCGDSPGRLLWSRQGSERSAPKLDRTIAGNRWLRSADSWAWAIPKRNSM
ncbi:MAG: hypothetical protein AAFU66_06675, partial [Pseudomonadota bacterium]